MIFVTNSPLLMACTPLDGALPGDRLVRDYFTNYRVEFPEDVAIEFHLTPVSGFGSCGQPDLYSRT